MFLIQEILVSDSVIREQFLCKLDACKGACCWEGDFGAPLEDEELETLKQVYGEIKPFLRAEGVEVLEKKGLFTWFDNMDGFGTTLLDDGACAYLTFDERGIAKCGIEKAWEAGATAFRKPISCHLYPIRISKNEAVGFEAMNYDQWDICSAACQAGKSAQLPIYRFVKEALIRKYGEAFYEELDAVATDVLGQETQPV
jgi:hypothetical protein